MPRGIYQRSPEHRNKISKKLTGTKKSPETIQKMSKPKSLQHIENIKISKAGENNPMWGRKLTPEHKAKISQALIGKKKIRKLSIS